MNEHKQTFTISKSQSPEIEPQSKATKQGIQGEIRKSNKASTIGSLEYK